MLTLLVTCVAVGVGAQNFAAPTLDWMLSLGTIVEVAANPTTGALLIEVDGFSGDDKTKRLYIVNADHGVVAAGAKPQLIATTGKASAPAWSPSGKSFAYVSTDKGPAQLVVRAPGGAPKVVTHGKRAIEEFTWVDESRLLVSYSKRIGCTEHCLDEPEAEPTAYVADDLLFRHWDSWTTGKRTVIAELSLSTGAIKQISDDTVDAPPFELQEPRDFDVASGGRWVAYGIAPAKNAAVSNDLELVLYDRTTGARSTISDSRGIDDAPRFSPDGHMVAFRSLAREQAEADRAVLWLYDVAAGTRRALSSALDRSVQDFAWSADSHTVYFTVADDGGASLYRADVASAALTKMRWAPSLSLLAASGKQLFVTLNSPLNGGALTAIALDAPDTDIAVADFNTGVALTTKPTFESIHVRARDGTALQAWVTRPAGGGKNLKTVLLIHGGPQGAWDNGFNSRWNAALFAGLGYLVVQPNPRGSLGFGQKFTDAVSHHWGAEPYDDIMDVLDDVIRRGDANPATICAAGASYGGYMIDWIAGHTDRFKCLISHAGVFDTTGDYFTTEELWSDEWDFGKTPWENPQGYAEFSPSRFVAQMKTPMLITAGELDYRVSYTQSVSLFTALRRRDVPARLVIFPGENHWVLSAKGKRLWWHEVSAWLGHYL